MGIKIKPGISADAKRELWAFIAAYPINQVGAENGMLLFFLPCGREDEADCFSDMELNTYCGTFDILAYFKHK